MGNVVFSSTEDEVRFDYAVYATIEIDEQESKSLLDVSFMAEILSQQIINDLASIELVYSGSSDTGGIDDIILFDKFGKVINETVEDRNEFYQILQKGFEINEGGQGRVVINYPSGEYVDFLTINEEQLVEDEAGTLNDIDKERILSYRQREAGLDR